MKIFANKRSIDIIFSTYTYHNGVNIYRISGRGYNHCHISNLHTMHHTLTQELISNHMCVPSIRYGCVYIQACVDAADRSGALAAITFTSIHSTVRHIYIYSSTPHKTSQFGVYGSARGWPAASIGSAHSIEDKRPCHFRSQYPAHMHALAYVLW